jgi:glyoxylase-like metal-dependent hydrolase (beta-lactamase superfamily II)
MSDFVPPTRRHLLKLAATTPILAMPRVARASISAPEGGNPSHYRFRFGDAKITIISDGFFTRPLSDMAVNASDDEKLAFVTEYFQSDQSYYNHTNHMYVEIGDARVLVDVGSGNRAFSTTGRLISNMEAVGIDPYAVTHIVITHAHPDHILAVRDDFDEPLIPDAEHIIAATEHAFWTQDGLVDRVGDARQSFVLAAVNSINAEGLEWTLAQDGHQVVPGVHLIGTPGHTPGHMSVMLDSGGAQMIALGDALAHAYVHFLHPDWAWKTDEMPEQAAATRRRLLDMAATDRITILGYHFPFPGIGNVRRDGDQYQFIPAIWQS